MLNVGLEQQQRIWGADSTILWAGAQVIANSFIAISAEAAPVAILQGEAVLWDGGTAAKGFIPRSETTAANTTPAADLPGSLALFCKRTPASAGTAINYLGVAQDPIGAGKRGFIAGSGSLVSCLVDPAATIAIGTLVTSSATAGLQAAAGVKSATVPAYGTILGQCFKTNTGTPAAPGAGTGSTSWIGLLVMPT